MLVIAKKLQLLRVNNMTPQVKYRKFATYRFVYRPTILLQLSL